MTQKVSRKEWNTPPVMEAMEKEIKKPTGEQYL